jgi:hypothetical protein
MYTLWHLDKSLISQGFRHLRHELQNVVLYGRTVPYPIQHPSGTVLAIDLQIVVNLKDGGFQSCRLVGPLYNKNGVIHKYGTVQTWTTLAGATKGVVTKADALMADVRKRIITNNVFPVC